MSSAICFNLDQSTILSSVNGLITVCSKDQAFENMMSKGLISGNNYAMDLFLIMFFITSKTQVFMLKNTRESIHVDNCYIDQTPDSNQDLNQFTWGFPCGTG